MSNEIFIKELKEHLKKLETINEYHILSAAKFIEEKYKIDEKIKHLEGL